MSKRVSRAIVEKAKQAIAALPDSRQEVLLKEALADLGPAIAEKASKGYSTEELLKTLEMQGTGIGGSTLRRHIRAVKRGKSSNGNGQAAIPPPVTPRVEGAKTPAAATAARSSSQGGGAVKILPIDKIADDTKKPVPQTESSLTNNLRRREY